MLEQNKQNPDNNMPQNINIFAGKNAFSLIRNHGLSPDLIEVVAGAAGGPKWLILYHLDKFIFSSWITPRTRPLFLVGSSIGAWRFAAVSQKDPSSALKKFKNAYIHQVYLKKPTADEVTRESIRILNTFMDDPGTDHLLEHPCFRLNLLSVYCQSFAASDHPFLLAPAMLTSAMLNAIDRRLLGCFYKRALFYHPKNIPPFMDMDQFPLIKTPLNRHNIKDAILSTGSIPLVMKGVNNIFGAPPGVYRDGGILDYHLDINFLNSQDKIVLYPHYTDRIIPGWFDKKFFHRKPDPKHMAPVLMISPSKALISKLPMGKIPDRDDFFLFKGKDSQRIAYWKKVTEMGKYMAEEFHNVVESGRICQVVKPLDHLKG